MKIRSIHVDTHDRARLKELLHVHEGEVDRLSEQELELAEQTLAWKVRALVSRPRKKEKHQRQAWIRWSLGLSAAAASLFLLQPPPMTDSMQTKGVVPFLAAPCEVSLVSDERMVIEDLGDGFQLPTDHAVYVRVYCQQSGFVQGIVGHPQKEELILAHNQKLSRGYTYLEYQAQVQDVRAYKGGELRIWVSESPQPLIDVHMHAQLSSTPHVTHQLK